MKPASSTQNTTRRRQAVLLDEVAVDVTHRKYAKAPAKVHCWRNTTFHNSFSLGLSRPREQKPIMINRITRPYKARPQARGGVYWRHTIYPYSGDHQNLLAGWANVVDVAVQTTRGSWDGQHFEPFGSMTNSIGHKRHWNRTIMFVVSVKLRTSYGNRS